MRNVTNPPNPPRTDAEILAAVESSLRDNLSWMRDLQVSAKRVTAGRKPMLDAVLEIQEAARRTAFQVRINALPKPTDVAAFTAFTRPLGEQNERCLLAARYISQPLQQLMRQQQLSYADAVGNFTLFLADGSVLSRQSDVARDPWRGPGRPAESLKGRAPAAVIRALLEIPLPASVPQLIAWSGASASTAYRVVRYCEAQALVRLEGSTVASVNRSSLARRWSEDYSFFGSNNVSQYLAPRGIRDALDKLRQAKAAEYAITGSVAAADLAPYAEATSLNLYATDPQRLAEELGLRPVDRAGNVFIASTAFEVVFQRTRNADSLTCVSPAQTAVDLLSGPGRNPQEGEELLKWLDGPERRWTA